MMRYSSQYEERLDPFASFSRKVRDTQIKTFSESTRAVSVSDLVCMIVVAKQIQINYHHNTSVGRNYWYTGTRTVTINFYITIEKERQGDILILFCCEINTMLRHLIV